MDTVRIIEEFENATNEDVDELRKMFNDQKPIEFDGRKGKWIFTSLSFEPSLFERRMKGTIEYRRID